MRKRAEQAAIDGNGPLAKKLMDDAAKRTEEIEKTGTATDTDNKPFIVDGFSELQAQKSNIASNPKWFDEAANTARERADTRSYLNSMQEVLETYNTGALAESKAKLAALSAALGGPKLETAGVDAAGFQTMVKDTYNLMFTRLKTIGGRAPAAELNGLQRAAAGADLSPEANRKILAQARGILDYEDKFYRDAVDARKQSNYGLDLSDFQTKWSDKSENRMKGFTDKAYDEIPVRGATPTDWGKAKPGAQYIIEKGVIPGATKPKKVRFLGIDKATGKPIVEDVD